MAKSIQDQVYTLADRETRGTFISRASLAAQYVADARAATNDDDRDTCLRLALRFLGVEKDLYTDLVSTSRLTPAEQSAARNLRERRPAVIGGTNVIRDDLQRTAFYRDVTETMAANGITTPEKVAEFCDVAGIPN